MNFSSIIIIIIIINSTIIFEKRRKREKLTISRENRWVDRIDENQSLPGLYIYIYIFGRIYIYIVEEGHFSRGSAVIVARFRNHSDLSGVRGKREGVSTDRSLNPGYYREKLAANGESKFGSSFFSPSPSPTLDRSSSRVTRFPLLELTGCSQASRSGGGQYFCREE